MSLCGWLGVCTECERAWELAAVAVAEVERAEGEAVPRIGWSVCPAVLLEHECVAPWADAGLCLALLHRLWLTTSSRLLSR